MPLKLIDKVNSSDQSFSEKPRLSDISTTTKIKQMTIKEDDDACDNVVLSQRKKMGSSY